MSESFRPASEADLPAIGRLVAHSFVTRTAAQHQEGLRDDAWGGVENGWLAEEEGALTGFCQLLPLRLWIGGTLVPTMGLGTVAIAPTHRRRGLAARLIASGMLQARERGDLATALYPFRVSFYQKLGYGRVGEAHQYRVPPGAIPDAPEERTRVRLAQTDADRADLRAIYERWAPTQSGQVERGEAVWRRILAPEDRAAVLYRSDDGAAEGYAIVRYRGDLPPADRFLDVLERVWLTDGARRAIYAWLASLGDQWRLIAYRAHVDEPFGDLLEEPRLPPGSEPGWVLWYPSATLMRGPMFRLLDLRGALASRPAFGGETLTLGLRVEDGQVADNAGEWRVRLEDGRPTVERGGGAADATLSLSITTLSRIFIGAVTPGQAVEHGAASIDRYGLLPRLDAAFRLPRPWTFDGF